MTWLVRDWFYDKFGWWLHIHDLSINVFLTLVCLDQGVYVEGKLLL